MRKQTKVQLDKKILINYPPSTLEFNAFNLLLFKIA